MQQHAGIVRLYSGIRCPRLSQTSVPIRHMKLSKKPYPLNSQRAHSDVLKLQVPTQRAERQEGVLEAGSPWRRLNAEAKVLELGLKVPDTTAMLCKDYTRMMLVYIQASTLPVSELISRSSP